MQGIISPGNFYWKNMRGPLYNTKIIFQIEETYDLREGAISACISYHQDIISKSKELQDRNTQKQSQMHVSTQFFTILKTKYN